MTNEIKNKFNLKTVAAIVTMVLGASSMQALAYGTADDVNQAPFEKEFKALDTDSNGTLTRTEAGNDKFYTRSHFKAADLDNDGTLDQKEYADYKSEVQQKNAKRVVGDSVITTKVKASLLKEEGFKGLKVSVETHQGVVLLSGFVDNSAQVSRAEEVAKSIEGVKSVKNALTVKANG
jgi:hyperosmotically inducible periplasmic protein